jgi:hypothetical protein
VKGIRLKSELEFSRKRWRKRMERERYLCFEREFCILVKWENGE